jgi:hypothetical protein
MSFARQTPNGSTLHPRIQALNFISATGKKLALALTERMCAKRYGSRRERESVLVNALQDASNEKVALSLPPTLTDYEAWETLRVYGQSSLKRNETFDEFPFNHPLYGIHPPVLTCTREGCGRLEIATKKLVSGRGQFSVTLNEGIAVASFHCTLCVKMQWQKDNCSKKKHTHFLTYPRALKRAQHQNEKDRKRRKPMFARAAHSLVIAR